MPISFQGVIETATGNLLRAGYIDFANEVNFDPATESIRTDIPQPAYPRSKTGGTLNTQFHRWDGSQWVLVSQPIVHSDVYVVKELNNRRNPTRVAHYSGFDTQTNTFTGLREETLFFYNTSGRRLDKTEMRMYNDQGEQIGATVVEEYFRQGITVVIKTTEQ